MFRLALEYWVGHQLANAYFLVVGFWFMTTLVGPGIDQVAGRSARIRAAAGCSVALVIWAVVLASVAFPVVELDWFANLARTWGNPVAADQQLAGISVLLVGVAPAAIILNRPQQRRRNPEQAPASDASHAALTG